MTNGLNWDLDALVGAIMTDLRRNVSDSTPENVGKTLSQDFANVRRLSEKASETSEVFDVAKRVVVFETVAKLSATTNQKTWRFRADAVITPSALDELARRGVRVVRAGRGVSPSSAPSPASSKVTLSASNAVGVSGSRVSVANAESSESVARVKTLLATCLPGNERAPRGVVEYLTRNTDFTEARLDCMKKTTALVAESLAADESLKAVIATRDGAVGCVWANRKKGVRAVVAVTVEQAKRDLAATNANTLIFDPRDVGPYQARQIVDFFVQMKRG